MQRPCVFCGKPFKVDTSRRNWRHVKLCSDKCRDGVAAAAKRAAYKPKELKEKNCAKCGASFMPARRGAGKQLYCSRRCFLEKKAEQAHEHWTDAARERQCVHCGVTYVPKKFGAGKQIYCSLKCQVASIHQKKDRLYRRSAMYQHEFRIVKPVIMERDGKTCVICGSKTKPHVHHWDNSGRTPECSNSLDNLAVLCGTCHMEIHHVTLGKVNGQWVLMGKIFGKLGLTVPIPIKS